MSRLVLALALALLCAAGVFADPPPGCDLRLAPNDAGFSGRISWPRNWNGVNKYPLQQTCFWEIWTTYDYYVTPTDGGWGLQLNFSAISLWPGDYIEIEYLNDEIYTLRTLAILDSNSVAPQIFNVSGYRTAVYFNIQPASEGASGFVFNYKTIPLTHCENLRRINGTLYPKGILSDPYPFGQMINTYPASSGVCSFEFVTSGNQAIKLNLTGLDIPTGQLAMSSSLVTNLASIVNGAALYSTYYMTGTSTLTWTMPTYYASSPDGHVGKGWQFNYEFLSDNIVPCSGTANLGGASGNVAPYTPYGGGIGMYVEGSNCNWKITVAASSIVRLNFPSYALGSFGDGVVKLYDGTSTGARLIATLQGTKLSTSVFNSTGNNMYVVFTGQTRQPGFNAQYTAVASPTTTTAAPQSTTSSSSTTRPAGTTSSVGGTTGTSAGQTTTSQSSQTTTGATTQTSAGTSAGTEATASSATGAPGSSASSATSAGTSPGTTLNNPTTATTATTQTSTPASKTTSKTSSSQSTTTKTTSKTTSATGTTTASTASTASTQSSASTDSTASGTGATATATATATGDASTTATTTGTTTGSDAVNQGQNGGKSSGGGGGGAAAGAIVPIIVIAAIIGVIVFMRRRKMAAAQAAANKGTPGAPGQRPPPETPKSTAPPQNVAAAPVPAPGPTVISSGPAPAYTPPPTQTPAPAPTVANPTYTTAPAVAPAPAPAALNNAAPPPPYDAAAAATAPCIKCSAPRVPGKNNCQTCGNPF